MEVGEYLDFCAKIKGVAGGERKTRIADAIEKCKVGDVRSKLIGKLSKGYRQRVGLAQAILHDPKLVILDEPMSGLDPVGRREVRDIILELKNAGKTILFSTHILPDAETLCDRVGVIAGGKLVGTGAPDSIVGVKATGIEILFELPEGGTLPETIRAKAIRAGAGYRMNVDEGQLYKAMDELRVAAARIVAVTQIKPTLEDFFMGLVGKDRAQAAAVEVSGK